MKIKSKSHCIEITSTSTFIFYFGIIEADFSELSSSETLAKKSVSYVHVPKMSDLDCTELYPCHVCVEKGFHKLPKNLRLKCILGRLDLIGLGLVRVSQKLIVGEKNLKLQHRADLSVQRARVCISTSTTAVSVIASYK